MSAPVGGVATPRQNPFDAPAVVAQYEAWYETAGRRADRLEKRLLARMLAATAGTTPFVLAAPRLARRPTLLEVGCGTGHFTRWFEDEGEGVSVLGLDLSSAMLGEAARLRSTPCVQGSALALPFRTGAFDIVAFVTTLEFVADPERAVIEAARIARHGLLLGVLNRRSVLGWKLMRSTKLPWRTARLFTVAELITLIRRVLDRRLVGLVWRTTLWPLLPRELPLPWGGFIGMAVRLSPPRAGKECDPYGNCSTGQPVSAAPGVSGTGD